MVTLSNKLIPMHRTTGLFEVDIGIHSHNQTQLWALFKLAECSIKLCLLTHKNHFHIRIL
ncbi:Uncharacterised protein [Vibrio cholerae]|uniref:Uncharacterized protein n=1 Tax=Vibrio cholerae TaxID=666 RepID=A0A656AFR1_VIBCL|nr:Uncharacterised protein [Vibrio cholerae]CSA68299.1 Uncharacterised protein [Vibrio cholerae]CSB25354.1 Uncharacterised protein [Vibrio cholerae]CSB78679.1 Uncharacterised protein [Vibrio cholerae]CSC00435.1 Uncharacterised protein [Vibrio cholerae]